MLRSIHFRGSTRGSILSVELITACEEFQTIGLVKSVPSNWTAAEMANAALAMPNVFDKSISARVDLHRELSRAWQGDKFHF